LGNVTHKKVNPCRKDKSQRQKIKGAWERKVHLNSNMGRKIGKRPPNLNWERDYLPFLTQKRGGDE